MTSYTQIFGGSTIQPSDVSYATLALTADTTTTWPLEANTGVPVIARIMDITPSAAYSVFMPDATKTSPGQTVLFNNLGPYTVTIKSYTGVTLASLASGEAWQLYLTSVATTSGSWRTFQMGSLTSQAQASALAGYGTVATGSTLSASEPVTTFNSDYTVGESDRAAAYIWTGALGTLTLTSVSTLGNNWFVDVRNGGSGNLTIDPSASETINGDATLTLVPGDSCRLVNDGAAWYTIGFGQDAAFAFDYTLITLPSSGVATYTLAGSELNRIAYRFNGTLTANIKIIMPNTTQQYWVDNRTTGGSYTLSIATVAQAVPVVVPRNSRGIYYCDGSDVVNAATGGLSTPILVSDGGTGATSAGAALINLGGTSYGIGVFTAANAASARAAITAAAAGANSDITSLSGLTTPLSIAQGGTNSATATDARTALSAAKSGANSDITSLSALSTPLSVAQGGTGVATFTDAGVLIGNSTGAIQATTAGTAGQVLTSNGAGVDPTFQDLSSSSALVYLSTVTASNASSADVETTFDSTYDAYMIVCTDVRFSINTESLTVRLKLGGSYLSANYSFHASRPNDSSNSYAGTAAVTNRIYTEAEPGTTNSSNLVFYIYKPAGTTYPKMLTWTGVSVDSSNVLRSLTGAGYNTSTSALTGVRFLAASGNNIYGTFRLYGIANS